MTKASGSAPKIGSTNPALGININCWGFCLPTRSLHAWQAWAAASFLHSWLQAEHDFLVMFTVQWEDRTAVSEMPQTVKSTNEADGLA